MNKLFIFTLAIMSVIPASAMALDLQQARAQGLVVEQASGYVTAAQLTPEVNTLVQDVNTARKKEYERISKENGQPVDVVAKLAADQIRQKLGN